MVKIAFTIYFFKVRIYFEQIPLCPITNSMKNIFIICLSLYVLWAHASKAQNLKSTLQGQTNFFEMQRLAYQYFETKHSQKAVGLHNIEESEFTRFKRFEWYWKGRVLDDGSFPDPTARHKIYMDLARGYQSKKTRAAAWSNISQTTAASGYDGMGRLAAVAFHPTDTNIIYVGANQGGIWRTTTGGNNWTPLGDQLPFASVGNIVIDPINTNIIYITIGANEGWWQSGLGVYKSTDGGATWLPTANSVNFTAAVVYYKLMMQPGNNQVLFSAQSNGFYKSTDAGLSWTQITNGEYNDFEFKPGNPNTIYLARKGGSSANEIYKSTNAGNNFTVLSSFGQQGANMELSVTPTDSNYLAVGYEVNGNTEFYLSTNGGNSFVLKNTSIDDNAIIQISALNKNRIYCGYVSNHRSTDGGSNWTQITNWYNDGVLPAVHADNHFTGINPVLPHYIYFCNDGGLYRLNENNNTWKDLSQGLVITEFYKMAHSQSDSVFIIGGTQDNGGRKRVSMGNWDATNGGDGMEVAVNQDNDQIMYTTYWGGTLYRSYDRWDQDVYTEITPDPVKGAWVTPYMLDPSNQDRIIAGYGDVWISDDGGDNWNTISTNLTNSNTEKLEVLDVSRTNPNCIYTGFGNVLYHTNNLGVSWNTKILPANNSLTGILVHPKSENTIYVTRTGYTNKVKVYRSYNNGSNWTNISYNLPNVPVNCIQVDLESDTMNYDLYVGTDVGVFYKKEADTLWQYWGVGLPNTEVSDLEIYYPTNTLRAATYGRGIWETKLVRPMTPANTSTLTDIPLQLQLYPNPAHDVLVLISEVEVASSAHWEIVDLLGRVIRQENIFLSRGKSSNPIPIAEVASGEYLLRIIIGRQQKTIPWIKH